jgi:hypothetical protein
MFCKICKKRRGNAFANEGHENISVSALQEHAKSVEHIKLSWAKNGRRKLMEKQVTSMNHICNEALLCLFRATYFMEIESISFYKFSSIFLLIVSCKLTMTKKLYHDKKVCVDIALTISSVIHRQVLDRVRDSKFFGLMVDESTDISIINHIWLP